MNREEIPVVPGEVVGWRAWVIVTTGVREPRLRSLYFDVIWPTDEWLLCGVGRDAGDHGICAARDREHLVSLHRYGRLSYPRYVEGGGEYDGIAAIGEVGLAGLIIPGDRGYRAEKARPISIGLPYVAWELVEPLARAYRVPVTLTNVLTRGGTHGHRP